MEWMTDALDRFYTSADESHEPLAVKEEFNYSPTVSVGEFYPTVESNFNTDSEIGAALAAAGSSNGTAANGPRALKECGVCGDKALGYNFNAITCESCKAFFRRNALKTKEFRCPFNDVCAIDVVTRRFCQKCRLKKCYAIGMKKEWIMTDDEKRMKRRKVCDIRSRRQTDVSRPSSTFGYNIVDECVAIDSAPIVNHLDICGADVGCNSDSWPSTSPQSPHSPAPLASPDLTAYHQPVPQTPLLISVGSSSSDSQPDSPADHANGQLCTLAAALDTFTGLIDSNHPTTPKTLQNIEPTPVHQCIGVASPSTCTRDIGIQAVVSETEMNESKFSLTNIMHVAVRSQFYGWNETEVPSTELSHAERAKIHELLDAQQTLMAPLNEDNMYVHLVSKDPSLINVINLCDIAIRRLIQMSKKISSFRTLCQRDQIALLKGGCTELMILRSVTTYDMENNSWNIQASENDVTSIKLNVLKNAPNDVCEHHRQFNLTFRQQWKSDPFIMGLLSAIVLFSPDRANVEHKEAVSLEQDCYCYLLQRYLRTSMSGCAANTEFVRLARKLNELLRLNRTHVKLFANVDPRHIEPLLIEIFDLNHIRPACRAALGVGTNSDTVLTF